MMKLTLDKYMSLRADGRTREQVAEKVGILKSTLRSYLVQWGIADHDREAEMLSEWTAVQAIAHQGGDGREDREADREADWERREHPAKREAIPVQRDHSAQHEITAQAHESADLRTTGFERHVTMTLTEPIMRESLRATSDLAHDLARHRGWHEDGGSLAARIARMHADLSAALLAGEDEESAAHAAADALASVILRALDTAFAHDLDVVDALYDQLHTGDDRPSDAPFPLGRGHHMTHRTVRELPH